MDHKGFTGKPAKESTLVADEVVVIIGRLSIGRVLSVLCGDIEVTYDQQ
jgi:hypothetical protein